MKPLRSFTTLTLVTTALFCSTAASAEVLENPGPSDCGLGFASPTAALSMRFDLGTAATLQSLAIQLSDGNDFLNPVLLFTVRLHDGPLTSSPVIEQFVSSAARNFFGYVDFDIADIQVPAGTYSFSITGAGGRGGTSCVQRPFQGRGYFRNDVEDTLGTIPFRLTYAPIYPCVLQGTEDGTIQISCDSGDVVLPAAICTVTPDDGGGYLLACADGSTALISNGADGTDGTDGANGTSCGVADNGDGTYTIACEDGSEVVVRDGVDAEPCSVEAVDGGSNITCPDGTSVFVADGVAGTDGVDGTSCTVVSNSDGSATITCEDGTTATVAPGGDGSNGQDGSSCTVTDNADGTYTLTCEDGTEIILRDGAAGADGADGEPGADGADGEPGADGANGEAGADGADGVAGNPGLNALPCSVSQTAEGTEITCPDGTSALIPPTSLDDSGCTATGASPARGGSFMALLLGLAFMRRRRA